VARLLLLLFLAGCEATSVETDPVAALPVELGTLDAERRFHPLEPGAEVPFDQGLQGGWHLYVDSRVQVPEPPAEPWSIVLTLWSGAEALATIEHHRVPDLLPDDEGWPVATDLIVYLPEPDGLDGTACELELAITDPEGAGVATVPLRLVQGDALP
jgi:hypothetical protein